MDQTSYSKNRGSGNTRANGKGKDKQGQTATNQGQRKQYGKAKKKGRARQTAISGFSTLSQVSGAPLVHSYHSSISVIPPKSVIEPLSVCSICGEKIQTIAEAISIKEGYAHFDCVLDKIRNEEHLEENDTVSYIGSGSFAVCRKGEDGKYTIVKKIEIENRDTYNSFKNYVESLKQ